MWIYEVPAPPGGGPRNETWWDAMSGELLFSKVLHGGTKKKPYQNPRYFSEVNDAVIKRNLETLIRDRVTELEARKGDPQNRRKADSSK